VVKVLRARSDSWVEGYGSRALSFQDCAIMAHDTRALELSKTNNVAKPVRDLYGAEIRTGPRGLRAAFSTHVLQVNHCCTTTLPRDCN